MGATFLMVALGEAGHALPLLSVVEAVARRGHRALVFVRDEFGEGVIAAGGERVAPELSRGFLEEIPRMIGALPQQRSPLGILRRVRRMRALIAEGSVVVAQDLVSIVRREEVDCIVAGFPGFGARYAAELSGCLFASMTPNPLMVQDVNGRMMLPPRPWMRRLPAWLTRPFAKRLMPLGKARERLGLPPRGDGPVEIIHSQVSEALHLVMVPREFFPDVPLRAGHVCVGPLSFNLAHAGPQRFDVDSVKPGTVLVSTTTTPMEGGLLKRMVEALAPMGMPLLATGRAPELPTGLGEHVRIVPFAPHDELLPRVSAFVTHGGWGSVGRGLRHGVPMLIIPNINDQPLIGRRLAEMKLAYHLPRKKASPEAIRQALAALLKDEPLKQRVKAMGAKLQALDTPRLIATELEKLVASRAG